MRSTTAIIALLLTMTGTVMAADFNDSDYHEVILFDWETAQLDALVFLPAAADPLARLDAVEKSIAAWDAGINSLAPAWLANNHTIRSYSVGFDTIPTAALADPEILVFSGEVNPFVLFGIGLPWDYLVCDSIDPFLSAEVDIPEGPITLPPEFHQHPGSPWAVANAHCSNGTENRCVVINTNFAARDFSHFSMYDLNAHEFGHCLGIGHVGDANDFSAQNFPAEDIMSYQSNEDQVHCVSSLNIKALQGVYAKALGRPSSEWLDYGDYVSSTPSAYTQVSCANP